MSGRGMISAGSARLPEECQRGCEWCNCQRAGYCGPLTLFERMEIAAHEATR